MPAVTAGTPSPSILRLLVWSSSVRSITRRARVGRSLNFYPTGIIGTIGREGERFFRPPIFPGVP